jgi:hypothetical protein
MEMPGEVREIARKLRMELVQKGYRRLVQAIERNYRLAPGAYPWWDSLKAGSNAARMVRRYHDVDVCFLRRGRSAARNIRDRAIHLLRNGARSAMQHCMLHRVRDT